jgi:transcriptional regulator with XRE-family HTH domain
MSPLRLRVRELRLARGWTQAELAARAKVRTATISEMENGRTKGVDFDSLERLAAALEVIPQSLIEQAPKRRTS